MTDQDHLKCPQEHYHKFQFGKVKLAEKKHKEKEMEISFHFDLPQDKQELLQQKIDSGQVLTISELNNNFVPDIKEVTDLIKTIMIDCVENNDEESSEKGEYEEKPGECVQQ